MQNIRRLDDKMQTCSACSTKTSAVMNILCYSRSCQRHGEDILHTWNQAAGFILARISYARSKQKKFVVLVPFCLPPLFKRPVVLFSFRGLCSWDFGKDVKIPKFLTSPAQAQFEIKEHHLYRINFE